ncbi:MAG: hypothetical protein M0Q54_06940, partial [Pigmentiphaga sp.]|nr:hypothetical protein [Pigmentiphaga sp.]
RRMEFKLVQGVGHQALRRSVSRQGPRTSAERSEKQSEAQQETRLPPPAKKKGTITVKTPGAAPTTGLRTGKRAAAKKRSAR